MTGDKCDRCEAGFYGDPVNNVKCRPCECPGSGLTLSPTCVLDSDNSFTCDNCTPGYSGRKCELCANGYYRNSSEVCKLYSHCSIPSCDKLIGELYKM